MPSVSFWAVNERQPQPQTPASIPTKDTSPTILPIHIYENRPCEELPSMVRRPP